MSCVYACGSGSSARRASPAPSCCGSPPSTASSRSSWPPATRRPASRPPTLYPAWPAPTRRSCSRPSTPIGVDGLDVVFLGLPHEASHGARAAARRHGRLRRRPLRRLPAEGRRAVPDVVRLRARPARAARRGRVRPARAVPRPSSKGARAGRHARLLRRRRRRWRCARSCDAGARSRRPGIIVDAASGVSGAGRAPKHATTFCTVDEDFTAYGLLDHRHTPEIEQEHRRRRCCSRPHLAPMNRGILATCYARPTGADVTTDDAARRPARRLRRRAVRRRHRRARRRPRRRSAPTPPTSRPATTSAPATVIVHLRHRQPGQGRRRAAPSSRANLALGLDETAGLADRRARTRERRRRDSTPQAEGRRPRRGAAVHPALRRQGRRRQVRRQRARRHDRPRRARRCSPRTSC